MTQSALILFGHGGRDPRWAEPLERIQAAIQARDEGRRVVLAFLEFLPPNLETCVAGLIAEGIGNIQLVPIFIAQGGHLQRDLPPRIEALRLQYPHADIRLVSAIGEVPTVIAAMADHILSLA